jgi:hypothetical protein
VNDAPCIPGAPQGVSNGPPERSLALAVYDSDGLDRFLERSACLLKASINSFQFAEIVHAQSNAALSGRGPIQPQETRQPLPAVRLNA